MSIENSQIVWPVSFVCTLVTENTIIPNSYNINLSIMPTEEGGNISVGFKKIKYVVEYFLHNSIFISKDNPLVETLSKTNANLVLFPIEPYDLFVGHVLYTKFLAISEKYFHIDMISIDSIIGDNICYNILDTDGCGLELEGDSWWNTDSAHTGVGPVQGWGDITEDTSPKFEPKIIKGGKQSDNR